MHFCLCRFLKTTQWSKFWLLIGNLVILSTMVSYHTLGVHILISGAVFGLGKFISTGDNQRARFVTGFSILALVVLFFIRNYPKALGIESFQLTSDPSSIIQRLGISYILFRHIQFLVDSFKKRIRVYSLLDYINFILFFPNFLAGPIDKYNNFKTGMDRPFGRLRKSLILPGLGRILMGFIKKYALVPLIYADAVHYNELVLEHGESMGVLLNLLYFSLYIFLDFSGYSDIAIGSGYLMGVRTPENFMMPYLANNIADFWRRWHMTFSEFLRELIFKPIVKGISKSRTKWPRLSVSIIGYILTFVLCGIWHGDTVNFIYWGLWHGIGLSVYKAWSGSGVRKKLSTSLEKKSLSWLGNGVAVLITFLFVTFGWVFFQYTGKDLSIAINFLMP